MIKLLFFKNIAIQSWLSHRFAANIYDGRQTQLGVKQYSCIADCDSSLYLAALPTCLYFCVKNSHAHA